MHGGRMGSDRQLFPAGTVMKTDSAELGHDIAFGVALPNVLLETIHPEKGWKIVIKKIMPNEFGNAARYDAAGNIREYLTLPQHHKVGYVE